MLRYFDLQSVIVTPKECGRVLVGTVLVGTDTATLLDHTVLLLLLFMRIPLSMLVLLHRWYFFRLLLFSLHLRLVLLFFLVISLQGLSRVVCRPFCVLLCVLLVRSGSLFFRL